MMSLRLACCSVLVPVVLAFASCSSSGSSASHAGTGGTASGGSGAGADDGGLGLDGLGSGTGGSMQTGGGDSGASYLIYAHTDTTLFSLDPTSSQLVLTQIGDFDCIGPFGTPGKQSTAMTDLAVDKAGNLWGLSSYGVRSLTIQGTTVHCGQQIQVHVPDPNSTNPSFPFIKFEALTFAPQGVIKPGVEMLVAGDTAGQLWVIDTSTMPAAAITQHGSFGVVPADDGHGHAYKFPGGTWELSGDIVFLANNGSPVGFATVRDCPKPPDNMGCNQVDTLMEIDMTALAQMGTQSVKKAIRGQILEAQSCGGSGGFGFGNLFGIASWNDKVYGFSRHGDLVQISNVDGTACLVKNYASDAFSGAAVTTLAPVKAPPMN